MSFQDVNILYSIVSLASQSQDPPFRALFSAYDTILAEHGIHTEHDQIYFRYLLRLGEGPTTSSNRGLIAKFRALLARLDIHIVIGGDAGSEDGELGIDQNEENAIDDHYALGKRNASDTRGRGRRRVSFNDSNLEETWVSGGRLDTEEPSLPNGRIKSNGVLKPPSRLARSNGHALPARLPSQPSRQMRRGGRARSLSTQGSFRIRRPPSRDRYGYEYPTPSDRDASSRDASTSDLDYLGSSPPVVPPPVPEYTAPIHIQLPLSQMMAMSSAFSNITSIRNARHLLHHWHDHTLRSRQTAYDMYQIASNYDRQTLLTQAFTTWRSSLKDKRRAEETDRFFNHLERRATRARDLFLLNKAFTHWARSASDEVKRTSVAKRHILRTRYFNAWRDITAVNELKSRRLGLRKWLHTWRANAARNAVENDRAVAVYEEELVERTYWKWFWAFCERRAPMWRETRLKKRAFSKLAASADRSRQLDWTARDMRNYHLARRAVSALAVQTQSVNELDARAIQHRRTHLLSQTFNTLKKHSQLAPRWREYEQGAASRLMTKTIFLWSLNTTFHQQATAVFRQRILRNSLRRWNDVLRTKVITNMMDGRIKAEAWYKLILAERLSLFRRITDYRFVQHALQTMSVRLAESRFRLGEAEAIYHQGQRRRLLQSVMLKFNRGTRNEELMERQALEFRNTHLMRDIIPTWRRQNDHLQQLDRWSQDARFYCLTHTSIRRWKEATDNAKRAKRRNAYSTIRRRGKISLIQRCLEHWRDRSGTISQLSKQADAQYHVRLFGIGTAAFDQWHQMTLHCAEINGQSEEVYTRRLFSDATSQLIRKGREVMHNQQEAENYANTTVHAATKSEMMRRMKWNLFCLKRNKENASALKDRNSEQHRRNMLRYWADQAMQRKALKTPIDPDSPTRPAPSLFSSLRLPSARKPPPSIQRPATTGRLPDSSLLDPDHKDESADEADEEMDFGASTTARAEEWTSFDLLRDFNASRTINLGQTPALPTLNEEAEPNSAGAPHHAHPSFATPQPGYMRTPSKRTARQRTRFKALSSAQRPRSAFASLPGDADVDAEAEGDGPRYLASTTPAPLRPGGLRDMGALTPQVTPFERKMRAGGFGANNPSAAGTTTPGFGRSRFGRGSTRFGGPPATTGRSVRFFDPGTPGNNGGVGRGGGTGNGNGFDGAHEKSS